MIQQFRITLMELRKSFNDRIDRELAKLDDTQLRHEKESNGGPRITLVDDLPSEGEKQ